MSHELRTPLNAILGFGQLLEIDSAGRLAEQQRGYVSEILRAGRHLLDLINEVLDLARIEAGNLQLSLEPVQVAALLRDCLNLLQPVAREHGVALDADVPTCDDVWASADRIRLKQVLLNLLANAIKYNRTGGSVSVGCAPDGDGLRISVSDEGRGLDRDQLALLFQAFERLGAENTAIEGTGIGLALSKRLVERMRGQLGVDSQVGSGSTFWVRLPRAEPPHVPAGERRSQRQMAAETLAPGQARRTVLYIEDNAVNVLLMESVFAQHPGVQLIAAHQPTLGLDLARTQRPDLILLDIQLPGLDGYEVLRRLRSVDITNAIPVVAISADAMPGSIERGLAAGFVAYLTKPLDIARLLAIVDETLRS
jgi:CheY-like chemotaxis protein/anti-sigma regulatory factor (Ser/Thr protein kinase)